MQLAHITHFPDATAACKVIPKWLKSGDLILLKASRAIRLESVAQTIADSGGNGKVLRKVAS